MAVSLTSPNAAGAPEVDRSQTLDVCILVGGLGTRVRSITGPSLPKPMLEVAGRPFLEHLLLWLRDAGYSNVHLLAGHGADEIRDRFGEGAGLGMSLTYVIEPGPLGTGGALVNARDQLRADAVLMLNGDSFLRADPRQLEAAHRRFRTSDPRVVVTMALTPVADIGRYGSVELGEHDRVTAFREKADSHGPGLINAGLYVIERDLLDQLPAGPLSLERDVLPTLTAGRLAGLEIDAPFVDIGTPESLAGLIDDPGAVLPDVSGASDVPEGSAAPAASAVPEGSAVPAASAVPATSAVSR
jgi:NDP-sugar pyrophosphorylase family protein